MYFQEYWNRFRLSITCREWERVPFGSDDKIDVPSGVALSPGEIIEVANERIGNGVSPKVGNSVAMPIGGSRGDRTDLSEAAGGLGRGAPIPLIRNAPEGRADDGDEKVADCESGRLRVRTPIIERYELWDIFSS
jgi:hypothetical protein